MSEPMEIEFKSDIDVALVQHCGGDHIIVAAARVSTSGSEAMRYATSESTAENGGLINYLMKHRHGSPFEHGLMTFFVHAPIFVWREWHRHRIGFSYNEESARYTQLKPVFYLPSEDRPMFKVKDWKPARPKFETVHEMESDFHYLSIGFMESDFKESYQRSYEAYLSSLKADIDPGLARACLPVGIYASCWVTCNPRSLMTFLSLRTHEPDAKFVSHPLHEIEIAARKCEAIFAELYPITYKAFCDNGRVGP